MTGGINNVDFDTLVVDRCILCQDRDATLPLEFVGIHDAGDELLILAECTRLPQHVIHERSFAVVNMRNYGNISDVLSAIQAFLHTGFSRRGCGQQTRCALYASAQLREDANILKRGVISKVGESVVVSQFEFSRSRGKSSIVHNLLEMPAAIGGRTLDVSCIRTEL
jgi:hypothetical protein